MWRSVYCAAIAAPCKNIPLFQNRSSAARCFQLRETGVFLEPKPSVTSDFSVQYIFIWLAFSSHTPISTNFLKRKFILIGVYTERSLDFRPNQGSVMRLVYCAALGAPDKNISLFNKRSCTGRCLLLKKSQSFPLADTFCGFLFWRSVYFYLARFQLAYPY